MSTEIFDRLHSLKSSLEPFVEAHRNVSDLLDLDPAVLDDLATKKRQAEAELARIEQKITERQETLREHGGEDEEKRKKGK